MYLVFIAMLALNMSKEVLTAFGLIEESVSQNNTALNTRNRASLDALNLKALEQDKFKAVATKAKQINKISDELDSYIAAIKDSLMSSVEEGEEGNYEVQDKPDYLNDKFFQSDNLSPDGEKFIEMMENYRTDMIDALG